MIRKVVTAKDGEKSLSVEYNPLSREWKLSSKRGKTICSVPSDRSLVKFEDFKSEEKKATLERLKAYARERFPESRQDTSLTHNRVYLALCKDCADCEEVELEPFALARLYSLHSQEGFLIDWGRRKTVFVEVKGGLLQSFRVVLKGGDYLTRKLSESRNINLEEGERLKRSEGMSLKEVEEAVKDILELSGYSLEGKVLLTGGGSRLKGLRSLFPESIDLTLCEREYAVCLGVCLREVLKNPYPSFRKKDLTPEDIRKLAYSGSGVLVAFALSLFGMQKLYSVESLKEAQRAEFKKLFPKEPIVSLHQQVRAKVSTGEEFRLTKLLVKAQESLKPGMKLYSFEYAEGRLTLRGEADRSLLEGIKLHSTKETPTGKVEFELRVP
ncbi:MAG: cell division protein FtsA [Aquificaceae bacterium]|nr:cell division protein FtsA [Aquificaceae bacterium]